jgi:hypothetical protein
LLFVARHQGALRAIFLGSLLAVSFMVQKDSAISKRKSKKDKGLKGDRSDEWQVADDHASSPGPLWPSKSTAMELNPALDQVAPAQPPGRAFQSPSGMLPQSPAWFDVATVRAETVKETLCNSGAIGYDSDIVLLHLPPGTNPQDLHDQYLALPDGPSSTTRIKGTSTELACDTKEMYKDVFVLGVQSGTVVALPVTGSFRIRQCLNAIEAEEDAVDEALLDDAMEAEKQLEVDKEPKKGKKQKRSRSARNDDLGADEGGDELGQAGNGKVASGQGEVEDSNKRKKKEGKSVRARKRVKKEADQNCG